MDLGPPISHCDATLALPDVTHDAQLIWNLSQHCGELLEDKRQLIGHCKKALNSQDAHQQQRASVEASLIAANEHFRLKIIGLMTDVANLEEERVEANKRRIQEAATNSELRTELNACRQEKELADSNLIEMQEQLARQIQERTEAKERSDELTEQLKMLESRWQCVTEDWIAEKVDLVKRANESRDSDLEEISSLRKSCADADCQLEKLNEEMHEFNQMRAERETLHYKAANLEETCRNMRTTLLESEEQNEQLRVFNEQLLSSESAEQVNKINAVAELEDMSIRMQKEQEECARRIEEAEAKKIEMAHIYENQSAEIRRMSMQQTSKDRVFHEMERQLTDVKFSYVKLEETMRRQTVEFVSREEELREASERATQMLREEMAAQFEEATRERMNSQEEILRLRESCRKSELENEDYESQSSRESISSAPKIGAARILIDGSVQTDTDSAELRLRTEVEEDKRRAAHASAREDELTTEIQSLIETTRVCERELEEVNDVLEQLNAGFHRSRAWRDFEPDGENLPPNVRVERFLKYVAYQEARVAEIEESRNAATAENVKLVEVTNDLRNELSTSISERESYKNLAMTRAEKLRKVREMIKLWVKQHESGRCGTAPDFPDILAALPAIRETDISASVA